MSNGPSSIEFVVRIGDAPPPPAAIDRWPNATWSHHADPLDGLVELGRRVFESRTTQAWAATNTSPIAVLITLRESSAELASAIATHLPTIELLLASSAGDLVEIDGAKTPQAPQPPGDPIPSAPSAPVAPSDGSNRVDSRTVSSEEIRMLLEDAEADRPEDDR